MYQIRTDLGLETQEKMQEDKVELVKEGGDVINGFYRNELDYMFVLGDLPDKCQKCSIMPICMGGCSSDRILHQKFVNCDYMKRKLVENCILVEKLKHSG